MCHRNIRWRRQAVAEDLKAGGEVDRYFLLRFAVEFGCSTSAIRQDVAWIRKGGTLFACVGDSPAPLYRANEWDRTCLAVLKRDGCRCHYCGSKATEIDHITPRALGGGNELSNLAAACRKCNTRKWAHPLSLFNPVVAGRARL